MKKTNRVISLLLVIVFVTAILQSCTNRGESSDTTKPDNEVTTVGKYNIGNEIPSDVRFEGQTVKIISRNGEYARDEIEVEGADGVLVNDAVYKRNENIERKLGVKIDNTAIATESQHEVINQVRNLSGSYMYDIIANNCYSTIMYTNEGIFRDLNDVEHIDLSRPYWSQGFNEAASAGDSQYMCTGAVALTFCRYMFVTMLNLNLAERLNIENLYDVVNSKKWTLDYQAELNERAFVNLNDVNTNIYGFVSCQELYVDPYWSSCQLPILTKDADNYYCYSMNYDKTSSAVDKLLKLYYGNGAYICNSVSDTANQMSIVSYFASDRALTATLRLAAVENTALRDMTSIYGILPIPKYDDAQEDYKSYLHDKFTAFAILSTVPVEKLPMVGAFLEYFASESYAEVLPKYYDLALKNRYLHDKESAEMLDLIYENVYIDAGVLYTIPLKSLHMRLRNIIEGKTNTTASAFKGADNTAKLDVKSLNMDLKALK